MTRKLHTFEEQLERTEERLAQTTNKLEEASHTADERERSVRHLPLKARLHALFSSVSRSRKTLENQLNLGSDRSELLEVQLKEARALASESDKKYDEVSEERLWYIHHTRIESFF